MELVEKKKQKFWSKLFISKDEFNFDSIPLFKFKRFIFEVGLEKVGLSKELEFAERKEKNVLLEIFLNLYK